jgi:hypothetical protein
MLRIAPQDEVQFSRPQLLMPQKNTLVLRRLQSLRGSRLEGRTMEMQLYAGLRLTWPIAAPKL